MGKAVKALDVPPALLHSVILEHVLRSGRVEVAKKLAQEAQLRLDQADVQPYVDVLKVMADIKVRQLDTALAFVETHKEHLLRLNLTIGFEVAKKRYLQLLLDGHLAQAIRFSKRYFPPFFARHSASVRELMGCVAYVKRGIINSPYKHLVCAESWANLAQVCTLNPTPQKVSPKPRLLLPRRIG